MNYNKSTVLIIVLCVALLVFSSCATGYIKESIGKEASLVSELNIYNKYNNAVVYGKPYKLPASYVGLKEKDGEIYYGIAIENIRNNASNKQILLLIPTNNMRSPVFEECLTAESNPIDNVEVFLEFVPLRIGSTNYSNLAKKYQWDIYPRRISIGFNNFNKIQREMWAIYRIGINDQDLESKIIIDNLDWISRRKILYYGKKAFIPVGYIIDVVTFPFQFIYFVLYFRG